MRDGHSRGRFHGVNSRRWRVRRHLLWGASWVVAACAGPADRAPTNDTTGVRSPAPGTAADPTRVTGAWPTALGGMLVIATDAAAGRTGLVLLPDSQPDADVLAATRGARLELVGPAGRLGEASVVALERDDSTECVAWPTARLQATGDSLPTGWTLGARAGATRPLAIRTLAGLGARDSARVVVELARLASGLPGDTNPAFRGLPMIVRAASMLPAPWGREVVVAEIVRRVGQEATPLEERIAVVAERDPAGTAGWRSYWIARIEGAEESIEATELVGGMEVGGGEVVLVVQRDSAKGTRYELLVGSVKGWERRWASGWSGC